MTNPYDQMRRATLSGRALEQEVLARATARLAAAHDAACPGAFEQAIEANRQLWMRFAADLALPANECSDALKAGLISLAGYVERRSGELLTEGGDPGALIEINRNVMAGLSGGAGAEAA